jgi:hypothetical protein
VEVPPRLLLCGVDGSSGGGDDMIAAAARLLLLVCLLELVWGEDLMGKTFNIPKLYLSAFV